MTTSTAAVNVQLRSREAGRDLCVNTGVMAHTFKFLLLLLQSFPHIKPCQCWQQMIMLSYLLSSVISWLRFWSTLVECGDRCASKISSRWDVVLWLQGAQHIAKALVRRKSLAIEVAVNFDLRNTKPFPTILHTYLTIFSTNVAFSLFEHFYSWWCLGSLLHTVDEIQKTVQVHFE